MADYYDGKWHAWQFDKAPMLRDGDRIETLNKYGERWTGYGVAAFPWQNIVAFRVIEPAPRTIRIGDMEVPEPAREEMEDGELYWVAESTNSDYAAKVRWDRGGVDYRWLRRGLIHRTREAAEAHARALIKISGGDPDA